MQEPAARGTPYVVAWLGLLALTATSFGVSRLSLGAFATPVVLGVAALKVSIVGLVFMHLGRARPTLQAIALTSVVFVVLLVVGIAGDVGFR